MEVDMKERIIKKLKSPVVWISFIALVVKLLLHYHLDFVADEVNYISNFALTALIMFGVLNNPDERNQF